MIYKKKRKGISLKIVNQSFTVLFVFQHYKDKNNILIYKILEKYFL